MSAANLAKSDAWWRRPDFLRQGEEKWPASKSFEKPTGDVELKRCATTTLNMQASPFMDRAYLTVTLGAGNLNFPLDPSHFSSWLRLRSSLLGQSIHQQLSKVPDRQGIWGTTVQ